MTRWMLFPKHRSPNGGRTNVPHSPMEVRKFALKVIKTGSSRSQHCVSPQFSAENLLKTWRNLIVSSWGHEITYFVARIRNLHFTLIFEKVLSFPQETSDITTAEALLTTTLASDHSSYDHLHVTPFVLSLKLCHEKKLLLDHFLELPTGLFLCSLSSRKRALKESPPYMYKSTQY